MPLNGWPGDGGYAFATEVEALRRDEARERVGLDDDEDARETLGVIDDDEGAALSDERPMRAAFIDGRDALFGLVIRPASTAERVVVETFGDGMSKREAVSMLRDVADALEAEQT